jgi:hypothetical protein
MWSSWVKEKGTTLQVRYIAKLKYDPKRVKKTFSMTLDRVFEMVWWRGRKWNHIEKNFWSWSVFLLSKYWLPLLFEETIGAFLFPPLFFHAPSHEDSGVLMTFKEKITSSKTSFQMASLYWWWTHIAEWSYACQLAKPWLWRWGSCGYMAVDA